MIGPKLPQTPDFQPGPVKWPGVIRPVQLTANNLQSGIRVNKKIAQGRANIQKKHLRFAKILSVPKMGSHTGTAVNCLIFIKLN